MRLGPLIALAAAFASPVAAAEKFLDGAYGDKEGCRYFKTQESSGADVFFLLTDEDIVTATGACEIQKVVSKKSDTFTVRIACESEGETSDPENVTLTKKNGAYSVVFADGGKWGPLPKCK